MYGIVRLLDPTWASINRGVLICDECCSVHRSLGRHISQIKSLNKGQWSPTLLSMVQHLANHGANSIWEHSLLDPSQSKHGKKKPGPRDHSVSWTLHRVNMGKPGPRDQVQVNMGKRNQGPSTVSMDPSQSKHGKRNQGPSTVSMDPSQSKHGKKKPGTKYSKQSKHGKKKPELRDQVQVNMGKRNQGPSTVSMDPSQSKHGEKKPGPRDQVHRINDAHIINSPMKNGIFVFQQLHSSVRTSNLETCLRLLSKGADPNYFHPEKGNCPLHVAAQSGQPLQVELLVIYGADPGAFDSNGKTPIDHAKAELYIDLADRILELHYELTDRLAYYVCKRKPDHKNGIHFIIPEMADSSLDLSELAKQAKLKLQALPNHLFEELAMDVYDEVDRRENDEHWSQSHDNSAVVSDRQGVPFLPLNPDFSATRNQGRQKLARFNAREFTTLVIDILSDAKRRQTGAMSPTQTPKEQGKDS
ncbi:GIT2 [Mytilus edulis]|uniref:GIT2 n=1 Tax=Mytilus edulis TaxID=6550 RepID=A0A8S3T8Z6_MYTED|nr:GIT2 [Mytilus edulis]